MPRRVTRLTALGSACETQRDEGEACAVRARAVADVHTLGQTGRGFNMLASLQPKRTENDELEQWSRTVDDTLGDRNE